MTDERKPEDDSATGRFMGPYEIDYGRIVTRGMQTLRPLLIGVRKAIVRAAPTCTLWERNFCGYFLEFRFWRTWRISDAEILQSQPLRQAKVNNMATGRPSKYQPSYCNLVIEHMSEGASLTSFAADIGVARSSINEWMEANPEFSEAVKIGKAKCAA